MKQRVLVLLAGLLAGCAATQHTAGQKSQPFVCLDPFPVFGYSEEQTTKAEFEEIVPSARKLFKQWAESNHLPVCEAGQYGNPWGKTLVIAIVQSPAGWSQAMMAVEGDTPRTRWAGRFRHGAESPEEMLDRVLAEVRDENRWK